MGHRKNTNPSLFIQVAKLHKMNEKRSRGIKSITTEHITWQTNSLILQLLLSRFYRLIFVTSPKS